MEQDETKSDDFSVDASARPIGCETFPCLPSKEDNIEGTETKSIDIMNPSTASNQSNTTRITNEFSTNDIELENKGNVSQKSGELSENSNLSVNLLLLPGKEEELATNEIPSDVTENDRAASFHSLSVHTINSSPKEGDTETEGKKSFV
jgi:hypothetical protein